MDTLFVALLPLLGCGLMMLACVGLMAGRRTSADGSESPARDEEIVRLRDEVAELRRRQEHPAEGAPEDAGA